MTSLKWNLELFEDSDLSCLDTPQAEFIDEIHGSTYRMIGLVNSLLNVSRVEMGTFAIHSLDISLKNTVEQVVNQFKEILRNRSISIRAEYIDVPEVYQIDPVVFEVILENLVSNAIKYTHDGTDIQIQLSAGDSGVLEKKGIDGNALVLEVADQGIGIPEAEQGKIFQRLFRASNAVTANTVGTGIGLYMVQKIVRDIGGTIWFETEQGKGTRFFVALPWDGIESREGEKVLEKHSVQE